MYCPYCGEEVKEGQRFCSRLGECLDESVLREAPVPPRGEAPKRSKRLRAAFVVVAVAIACVAAAGLALAFAFMGASGPATDEGVAPLAQDAVPVPDEPEPSAEAADAMPEASSDPAAVLVSDEESELLQFMALSYYEVMQHSNVAGDLVSGDVKGLDKAWLIRELAYPGLSSTFRFSSALLKDDARFSFETYSMQMDGMRYTAVSEEDGRKIIASYLGKDEVPDSDALANEAILFDNHQFLIMSADGAGGRAVECSNMQRVGDLVVYDCQFIKLSSGNGSEYERSPLMRVEAQVDGESIFGFHLASMAPVG